MLFDGLNVLAKMGDVVCGDSGVVVPGSIAGLISTIYTLIKVAVPLLLILFGMIDLGKAVISQKEDDIKKQQNLFIKRLIAAALVFFVFSIVQLLVNLVDDSNTDLMGCVKKIITRQ